MITSLVCIALIGTLQFNSAISAAINYEPIRITVNENFNSRSGLVSSELQEPGVLHQGANFYFKPQVNLPPSYIPSHIEGLMSFIKQHHRSCSKDASKVVVEKDKLIEILKPFIYPMSEISKETLSDIILEKENNLEIVKPIIMNEELKPITPELLIIPEAPEIAHLSFNGILPIVEEVKKEESVILEESKGVFSTIPEIAMRPITEPIVNCVEPKPITSELVVIPKAPVLPPLSPNDIHVVEEEVKIEEPIVVEVDNKPAIQELVAIPEAPVLPSLSLYDSSSIIEEEAKIKESVIFEDQMGVLSTIPEIHLRPIEEPIINYVEQKPITSEHVVIPEASVLAPLSANDVHVVEEEVKIEEPIVVDVEPMPAIQELVAIPETPMLPPLSFNSIPPIVKEEVEKEESIILEVPTGVFPTIPEIDGRAITEPIINYVESKPINEELVVIPEASVLAPLSANDVHVVEEEVKIEEPIVVDVEPMPAIQELVAIPETPVLPSLSLYDTSSIIEEEVKKEESVIFEEPTGVFPTIPEIKFESIEEPIINYVEPKPIISEVVVIPEAPVLPPLSANDIHDIEEVKIEESNLVDFEPKPSIQELIVIPDAPVLPSLSLHDIPSIIEKEEKKEESVILEESTGVFPLIPEISARPETVIVNVEPKPAVEELLVIPKAPVLPLLSDIPVVEEINLKESLILEEPINVSPPFSEISVRPIGPEQIITDVEPRPPVRTQDLELVVIPEAPVLRQLSYNGIPPIVEDVKIEESIKVEEPTGVFPSISEISARPFPEPFVVSETAESLALENNIFPIATEEVKIEVPILFEESIEVFPPTAEISSGPTLQESEITDSYVLEEVSQPNPESVVTIKETLPPTTIPKPSNNMGVFTYLPFVSQLSNRAPNTKKIMLQKPASVERFLPKKHPFRLPVTPFQKLDQNAIKSSIWGNNKQFLYPTSYAHDVIEKRIAPNMAFKQQNGPKRVNIYIRSNVPKGPSYL